MEILERTVSVECQGLKPGSMAFMREEVVRQWKSMSNPGWCQLLLLVVLPRAVFGAGL